MGDSNCHSSRLDAVVRFEDVRRFIPAARTVPADILKMYRDGNRQLCLRKILAFRFVACTPHLFVPVCAEFLLDTFHARP